MMRQWLKLISMLALACFLADQAQAEVIELPKEELAKESVLPVFDHPVMVKNRAVVTDGHFDVNLMYGMALSEPIYNVSRYGASLYYNTSENNAYGLVFEKMAPGLSSYSHQLDSQATNSSGQPLNLDFSRAPSPEQSLFLDWDWKIFYGKMSITKDAVVNTSLYTTLMGGMMKYTNKSYPGIAAGLGQRFFFTNHLALRFDFRLFANQAPIPFLNSANTGDGSGMQRSQPVPSMDKFSDRMTYTMVLNAGLTWLL